MYPVRKNRKMPDSKGRKWPAIFLTPLNYSEIARSATRTEDLSGTPSLILILNSLLMKLISLFRKYNSLISDFKFPVNFQFVANLNTRCPRRLLLGRERPQGAAMTAEFVLISSLWVYTLVNNVPVVLTDIPYGKCRLLPCEVRNRCSNKLVYLWGGG